jgi:hypothetical protein
MDPKSEILEGEKANIEKEILLTGETISANENIFNTHHLLKRPDTYDLKIFVRTFEKLSGRLRNRQDVCCQDD